MWDVISLDGSMKRLSSLRCFILAAGMLVMKCIAVDVSFLGTSDYANVRQRRSRTPLSSRALAH